MKMSVWMLIFLLGCRSFKATQSCNFNCKESLHVVCVPSNDTVRVPCPTLDALEVTFTLIKNEDSVSTYTCNSRENKTVCSQKSLSNTVFLKGNQTTFILTVTNASSNGIYQCEGRSVYPPPIRKELSPFKTLVLVQGHQCQGERAEECSLTDVGPVWIAAMAVLCTYSLIVSIIAVVNSVKLKRTDSYSDYINTKPRPSKDRKRKKGIQTPIPRYF